MIGKLICHPVLSRAVSSVRNILGHIRTLKHCTDQYHPKTEALSPSIWGSLSDTLGRRPIYLLTLLIYLAACIGLALTPTSTFGLLLFLRCLQSTGGSAVIAIGSGCIADVATPGERGKFIGVFNAISVGDDGVVGESKR